MYVYMSSTLHAESHTRTRTCMWARCKNGSEATRRTEIIEQSQLVLTKAGGHVKHKSVPLPAHQPTSARQALTQSKSPAVKAAAVVWPDGNANLRRKPQSIFVRQENRMTANGNKGSKEKRTAFKNQIEACVPSEAPWCLGTLATWPGP